MKKQKWPVTTMAQALECLKGDRTARGVLVQLSRSGFDESKIAGCVVKYCGGRPEDAKAGLMLAKNCVQRLAVSAKQLQTSANYVEQASRSCERYGRPLPGLDDVPETLRGYAKTCSDTAASIKDSVKNVRIGSSIASGRDDILLVCAYALSNGKKPSKKTYRQIATLVAAITGEPRYYEKIGERLRRSVDRLASTDRGKQLIIMAEEDDCFCITTSADLLRGT